MLAASAEPLPQLLTPPRPSRRFSLQVLRLASGPGIPVFEPTVIELAFEGPNDPSTPSPRGLDAKTLAALRRHQPIFTEARRRNLDGAHDTCSICLDDFGAFGDPAAGDDWAAGGAGGGQADSAAAVGAQGGKAPRSRRGGLWALLGGRRRGRADPSGGGGGEWAGRSGVDQELLPGVVALPCGHTFHGECCAEWFKL